MACRFHPEATSHNHYPGRFYENVVIPSLLEDGVSTALDIGSGEFCRHAIMLSEKGIKTDVFDVPEQVAKMNHFALLQKGIRACSVMPEGDYDAVLLNYVLNVIPEPEERNALLDTAVSKAKKFLMLSVRGTEFLRFFCKNAEKHGDGYVLVRDGMRTFNTAYEKRGIESIISDKGLEIAAQECSGLNLQYLCRKAGSNRNESLHRKG